MKTDQGFGRGDGDLARDEPIPNENILGHRSLLGDCLAGEMGPFRPNEREALNSDSEVPPEVLGDPEAMHRRRGPECGVEFAEAYSLVEAKEGCPLLPVKFRGRVAGSRAPAGE